jgi:hypothetical protein
MSIKTIHDQGAMNLIEAVVDQTVKDFMKTTPGSDSRKKIEVEILSDHFEALTGLKGSELLKHLQEKYNQKHQKTRKDKQV